MNSPAPQRLTAAARDSPPPRRDKFVHLPPQRFQIRIGKGGIEKRHRIAVRARAADGRVELPLRYFPRITRRPLVALRPFRPFRPRWPARLTRIAF